VLTPNVVECSLDRRGFYRKSPAAVTNLETVGAMFLAGYAHAVEARDATEAHERLAAVPAAWRGFAYEGAGMGAAVLDGLPFGGGGHVRALLEGEGAKHVYLIYVGVGWALARLPRFTWPAVEGYDPLLRGLVLDGYGFHQAYFATEKYVHEQYREIDFPWPGDATRAHSHHIIDQGIGRALWFVGGTDVDEVTALVEKFPEHRRADLYAGIGLASTYAGGVDAAELEQLRARSGEHRTALSQGSAFAAEARVLGELVLPHTEVAARVLCGTTPEHAARITQDVRPSTAEAVAAVDEPAYQIWRRAIAEQFTTLGGARS
jgi:hypothetical protein